MELSSAMQNFGRSLSGNNVKAVLCIRAVDALTKSEAPNPNAGRSKISGTVQSAITDVVNLESQMLEWAASSLEGKAVKTYSDIKDEAESNDYIAIEVQYNPTSIRLDTAAGVQRSYSGSGGMQRVENHITPAATTLSCELVFDDTNNMDAFMLSDNPVTGLTVGNLVSFGKDMYNAAKGNKYSIQAQMEGILALLTLPQAKQVIFFWGDMCFRGEMTAVSASYTMFNKKGYPIRGTLGITIRQGDGSSDARGMDVAYQYDEAHWTKSFETCFTTDRDAGKTGLFSKVTNNSLLNLKL